MREDHKHDAASNHGAPHNRKSEKPSISRVMDRNIDPQADESPTAAALLHEEMRKHDKEQKSAEEGDSKPSAFWD